jgi:hypothetical protein
MGELGKVLRFFLFLGCLGLVLVLLAKGLHTTNLATTLGATGEVLFFAGLIVLLLFKKG